MEVKIPETVNVVELESAPFKTVHEAADWARGHGVVGLMSSVDTGGKGEISISMMSIGKMLSGSAMHKSVTPAIHLAALVRLRDIIRESFVGECHPDYLKVNGRRSPENGFNPLVDIAVLYGCVAFGGIPYRSKTTLKFFKDAAVPTKAYSYEVSNIEVLKGIAAPVALPSDKTSIDVGILLNGVSDVNGMPLLAQGRRIKTRTPPLTRRRPRFDASALPAARMIQVGVRRLCYNTLTHPSNRGRTAMKINLANFIFTDKPTVVAEDGEFKAVGFRCSTGVEALKVSNRRAASRSFSLHVETGVL